MTDGQLGALLAAVSGLGIGLGTLIRFLFGLWLTDRKEQRVEEAAERQEERADRKEERRDDRAAITAVANAMTTMALKFDEFGGKLNDMSDNFDEVTGNHEIPTRKKPRAVTQPAGVRIEKPWRSEGG